MGQVRRNRSLKALLLWTLGLVYLFSFTATATALAFAIYHDQSAAWRERHVEAAQASARTLGLFLNQARQTLMLVGNLEHFEPAELTQAIQQLLAEDPDLPILEVVRTDSKGNIIGSAARDSAVLSDLFAIGQSNWFHTAQAGRAFLGTIQISADGAPYLIIAQPSQDGGVVAGRLDMRILWDLVADIHFGRTGSLYITNARGRVLAHPQPAFVLANTSIGDHPEFAALKQQLSEAQTSSQLQNTLWTETYQNFQGANVVGMITPLPGTPWLIVTEVLSSEIYATSMRAVVVLATGMLMLGLLVLLIMTPILNHVLFNPLEQVRKGAERIGRGDLGQVIRYRWNNEIGQVATSFNEMADRLRQRDAELAAHTQALAEAHDRALEASRLKSEFLATMSHEIRTPMNGIVGMADLLEATPLTPDQAEYADVIRNSANALLTIINDILDLSKVEAGRLELHKEPFALQQMVDQVVDLLATAAHSKHLRLSGSLAENAPQRCSGDPARLRQVLLNLVGNAVKFTEEGEVTVTVQTAAAAPPAPDIVLVRFEVQDTGVGISPDRAERLFTPFTQIDGSHTRRYGGTGLGLAISKRLVDLMGGQIGFESRPGQGSVFWFTVPLTPLPAEPGQLTACPSTTAPTGCTSSAGRGAEAKHGAEGKQATNGQQAILLVEDNLVNQKVALRQLQRLGYSAAVAANGREAVDATQRHNFRLILMDCQMPEVDGFEATRQIRSAEAALAIHTPIVAMTANAMAGDREACLAAGMDDYLAKPIRTEELHQVIDRWLETNGDSGRRAQEQSG